MERAVDAGRDGGPTTAGRPGQDHHPRACHRSSRRGDGARELPGLVEVQLDRTGLPAFREGREDEIAHPGGGLGTKPSLATARSTDVRWSREML